MTGNATTSAGGYQVNLHFDANGTITQIDSSMGPTKRDGEDFISVQVQDGTPFPGGIGMDTHQIDVTKRSLVARSAEQIAAANAPSLLDMRHRIFAALSHSDQYMMPDRNVANRDAWTAYRQALRDLSKLATPADMVKAWPTSPDGNNSVAHVRARV